MEIHNIIDHTVLTPFATIEEIKKAIQEGLKYSFYSLCISPYWCNYVHKALENSPVKVCTVIGFPYGYEPLSAKLETFEFVRSYVDEVDVVINFQSLLKKDYSYLKEELNTITQRVHQVGKVIKWIVESGNISKDDLKYLCEICSDANVDFMKTSTGVLGTGARVEDVAFIRQHTIPNIKIKASGGIRDKRSVLEFVEAGASRIGTSSGVKIVEEPPG